MELKGSWKEVETELNEKVMHTIHIQLLTNSPGK
jgi:hypothetical protein